MGSTKNDQLLQGNAVRRWTAILVVLMAIPLAWGFNARLATIRKMHQDEIRLKQAITDEEKRKADLESRLATVHSDEYAEHWARTEAKMSKPGEVTVVLVAPNGSPPSPAVPVAARATTSILSEWWNVFFGEALTP